MGLSVLVISRCATAREYVCRTLRIAGLGVTTPHEADTGRRAIDIINTEPPDVILLDVRMPMMGVVERIDRRREDGTMCAIPVIGLAMEDTILRIERVVIDDVTVYIRRPCTAEMLHSVVENVLGLAPPLPNTS